MNKTGAIGNDIKANLSTKDIFGIISNGSFVYD